MANTFNPCRKLNSCKKFTCYISSIYIYYEVKLCGFMLSILMIILCMDAFETWLKYKHRTSCLKRMASNDGVRLRSVFFQLNEWIDKQTTDFLFLRDSNHTKAFLLANIILGFIFIVGKYISGYVITYIFCMFLCVSFKIVTPIMKMCRYIQQDLESEYEYEGLMPEMSDIDIKLMSVELDPVSIDEKHNFDYWKPEDIPLEEASDSSENSSSLVTNFSMEKIQTLEKDVETSDSSEDEYIPLDQPKLQHLQSTLQVVDAGNSWGSSAYNAIWNLTGVVTNMMKAQAEVGKRKRVSSMDSSEGFEMIDENELT